MLRLVTAALIFVVMATKSLFAQEETVWVQIEAQPTLSQALERARDYAGQLQDVNGFTVRGGWYAIVLGPYLRDDAEQVLRVYRSEGRIPRDSFIAYSANFDSQYWPVGNAGLTSPSIPPTDTTPTPADASPPP